MNRTPAKKPAVKKKEKSAGVGAQTKSKKAQTQAPAATETAALNTKKTLPTVVEAKFVAAAGTPESFLPPTLIEVAFAGRSNVGKSTLMNALLQRRNLVRTSATPGCTRSINWFEARCSDELNLFLVDLPGYGYAQRSKHEREQWADWIEQYLSERVTLRAVVLLVDSRRGVEEEEQQLLDFLAATTNAQRPPLAVIVVATKVDKLPASQKASLLAKISAVHRGVIGFSAMTNEGLDLLWRKLRKALIPAELSGE